MLNLTAWCGLPLCMLVTVGLRATPQLGSTFSCRTIGMHGSQQLNLQLVMCRTTWLIHITYPPTVSGSLPCLLDIVYWATCTHNPSCGNCSSCCTSWYHGRHLPLVWYIVVVNAEHSGTRADEANQTCAIPDQTA